MYSKISLAGKLQQKGQYEQVLFWRVLIDAVGNKITEVKRYTLDYGNFLSKFEISSVSGTKSLSSGITLYNNDGITEANLKEEWIDCWQPLEASELGTGLVFSKNTCIRYDKYINSNKDLCNLYATLKERHDKLVY